ncbi:hypothetical protein [Haliea sp.]|uniref:hypothetical protein n=1 Tax=Haliea sp. TaxID=1932666 RepID=UPI003528DF79
MQDQPKKIISPFKEGAEEENALAAGKQNQGSRENFVCDDNTTAYTPMDIYAAKEAMAMDAENSNEGGGSEPGSSGSDSTAGSFGGPGGPRVPVDFDVADDPDDSDDSGGRQAGDNHTETRNTTSATPEKRPSVLDELRTYSLNEQVEDMLARKRDAVFVAGRLALAGQVTVFYAGPNTGKTLITLHLLREAIQSGAVTQRVFHINLDDDFPGLIQKAELGNRYGFDVIGSEVFKSPGENFSKLVDMLIEEGVAAEAVFILDTVKKFVNVMDKRDSTAFMTTCRRLTERGGTIIALAHVNKNRHDGVSVPAGTSDLLDDCDCAYVLDIVGEEKVPGGILRSVVFTNNKCRGPSVPSATYSYVKHDEGDYVQMFESVTLLKPDEADRIREENARKAAQAADQTMIYAVTDLLSAGELNQGDIIATLTQSHGFSRRKLTECLRRWSRPPGEGGLWQVRSGDHNRRLYYVTA